MFEAALFLTAFIAGAIASVAGFGIGSLLTPLFALRAGTQLAVAAISIPHFAATAIRFWKFRKQVDRGILVHFGVLSAGGGLCGAYLNNFMASPKLSLILGVLLIFSGSSGFFGFSKKVQLGKKTSWFAGALSGFFGGLVGNQGGIRSAALLSAGLSKQAFIGTATAIALIVDASRMPAYIWMEYRDLSALFPQIILMTAGAAAGTFAGNYLLRRIPEIIFNKTVSLIILALGIFMISQAQSN